MDHSTPPTTPPTVVQPSADLLDLQCYETIDSGSTISPAEQNFFLQVLSHLMHGTPSPHINSQTFELHNSAVTTFEHHDSAVATTFELNEYEVAQTSEPPLPMTSVQPIRQPPSFPFLYVNTSLRDSLEQRKYDLEYRLYGTYKVALSSDQDIELLSLTQPKPINTLPSTLSSPNLQTFTANDQFDALLSFLPDPTINQLRSAMAHAFQIDRPLDISKGFPTTLRTRNHAVKLIIDAGLTHSLWQLTICTAVELLDRILTAKHYGPRTAALASAICISNACCMFEDYHEQGIFFHHLQVTSSEVSKLGLSDVEDQIYQAVYANPPRHTHAHIATFASPSFQDRMVRFVGLVAVLNRHIWKFPSTLVFRAVVSIATEMRDYHLNKFYRITYDKGLLEVVKVIMTGWMDVTKNKGQSCFGDTLFMEFVGKSYSEGMNRIAKKCFHREESSTDPNYPESSLTNVHN